MIAATQERAPAMSEAVPSVVDGEEVKTMTSATVYDRLLDAPIRGRTRPRGVDRLVMRVAIVLLKWSRLRAERRLVTHEENRRRRAVLAQRRQREAEALRMSRPMGL